MQLKWNHKPQRLEVAVSQDGRGLGHSYWVDVCGYSTTDFVTDQLERRTRPRQFMMLMFARVFVLFRWMP